MDPYPNSKPIKSPPARREDSSSQYYSHSSPEMQYTTPWELSPPPSPHFRVQNPTYNPDQNYTNPPASSSSYTPKTSHPHWTSTIATKVSKKPYCCRRRKSSIHHPTPLKPVPAATMRPPPPRRANLDLSSTWPSKPAAPWSPYERIDYARISPNMQYTRTQRPMASPLPSPRVLNPTYKENPNYFSPPSSPPTSPQEQQRFSVWPSHARNSGNGYREMRERCCEPFSTSGPVWTERLPSLADLQFQSTQVFKGMRLPPIRLQVREQYGVRNDNPPIIAVRCGW